MKHPLTNSQIRPNVVLFGERIQHYNEARRILASADIVVIIGTSLTVEPAASLVNCIYPLAKVFNINPVTYPEQAGNKEIEHIQMTASEGILFLLNMLDL